MDPSALKWIADFIWGIADDVLRDRYVRSKYRDVILPMMVLRRLDSDLAELYEVPTKRLNEEVKRNQERFPTDFLFRLTAGEKAQVVANCDHLSRLKFSPALPYAFTEHGAIMAATILNSPRAIEMSVYVVRAFVYLREMIASNKELAVKFTELERKLDTHDQVIASIITAIRELMAPPESTRKRPIGFVTPKEK